MTTRRHRLDPADLPAPVEPITQTTYPYPYPEAVGHTPDYGDLTVAQVGEMLHSLIQHSGSRRQRKFSGQMARTLWAMGSRLREHG